MFRPIRRRIDRGKEQIARSDEQLDRAKAIRAEQERKQAQEDESVIARIERICRDNSIAERMAKYFAGEGELMNQTTWRDWPALIIIFALYMISGLKFAHINAFDEVIAKAGVVMGTFSPLVLVGVYTGTKRKWWKNDLASAMVQLAFGISLHDAPLAYTYIFDGGNLTPSFWAWIEISAPVVISLAILRLSLIFWLIYIRERRERSKE